MPWCLLKDAISRPGVCFPETTPLSRCSNSYTCTKDCAGYERSGERPSWTPSFYQTSTGTHHEVTHPYVCLEFTWCKPSRALENKEEFHDFFFCPNTLCYIEHLNPSDVLCSKDIEVDFFWSGAPDVLWIAKHIL